MQNSLISFLLVISISLVGCSNKSQQTKNSLEQLAKSKISTCSDDDCRMQQKCRELPKVDVPAQDMPDSKDKIELAKCSAEIYYYGLEGNPVDYEKARKCALLQLSKFPSGIEPDDYVLGDNQILEMIYANGYKVSQNLALATKYACQHGAFKTEIDALTPQNFNKKSIFSTCDYDNNDVMANVTCTSWLEWQINASSRKVKINQIIASWPKADLDAFNNLVSVHSMYIDQYYIAEVDQGMNPEKRANSTSDDLEATFFNKFIDTVNGKLPKYSDDQFAELDKRLNEQYKKIIHHKVVDNGHTTSRVYDMDALKEDQRSWINYKEAWVAFAKVHYPDTSANSFRAWLTKDRVEDLNYILDQIDDSGDTNESGL